MQAMPQDSAAQTKLSVTLQQLTEAGQKLADLLAKCSEATRQLAELQAQQAAAGQQHADASQAHEQDMAEAVEKTQHEQKLAAAAKKQLAQRQGKLAAIEQALSGLISQVSPWCTGQDAGIRGNLHGLKQTARQLGRPLVNFCRKSEHENHVDGSGFDSHRAQRCEALDASGPAYATEGSCRGRRILFRWPATHPACLGIANSSLHNLRSSPMKCRPVLGLQDLFQAQANAQTVLAIAGDRSQSQAPAQPCQLKASSQGTAAGQSCHPSPEGCSPWGAAGAEGPAGLPAGSQAAAGRPAAGAGTAGSQCPGGALGLRELYCSRPQQISLYGVRAARVVGTEWVSS